MGNNPSRKKNAQGGGAAPPPPIPEEDMPRLESPEPELRRLSIAAGHMPMGEKDQTGRHAVTESGTCVWEGKKFKVESLFYSRSLAGKKDEGEWKTNQDSFVSIEPFRGENNLALFGVMDGHGRFGELCSEFVKQSLINQLTDADRSELDKKLNRLLKEAFIKADTTLKKSHIDTSMSGTTCVFCVRNGDKFTCANAGDSRAVIGLVNNKGELGFKNLSNDHKPELPQERQRVLRSGGDVRTLMDENIPVGPYRVWVRNQMFPGLAMSRSLGDSVAHDVGVSCKPEIIDYTLDIKRDKFLIVASDGVWEFIDSQEAVTMVSKLSTPQEAAEFLVKESQERWAAEEGFICDDITAVVVFFKEA